MKQRRQQSQYQVKKLKKANSINGNKKIVKMIRENLQRIQENQSKHARFCSSYAQCVLVQSSEKTELCFLFELNDENSTFRAKGQFEI